MSILDLSPLILPTYKTLSTGCSCPEASKTGGASEISKSLGLLDNGR